MVSHPALELRAAGLIFGLSPATRRLPACFAAIVKVRHSVCWVMRVTCIDPSSDKSCCPFVSPACPLSRSATLSAELMRVTCIDTSSDKSCCPFVVVCLLWSTSAGKKTCFEGTSDLRDLVSKAGNWCSSAVKKKKKCSCERNSALACRGLFEPVKCKWVQFDVSIAVELNLGNEQSPVWI